MNSSPSDSAATGDLGEKLIFIISQPRAGSTLLQRILGAHPAIHTTGEPWLLLPVLFNDPFEAARPAPYDEALATKAIGLFLDGLPGGRDEYYMGLRRMFTPIYAQALEGKGRSLFLDKTPRYYFIVPQLRRTFPKAKFIFLLRDPLAVLASIVNSWTGENWNGLAAYRHDLLDAPPLIAEGLQAAGTDAIPVRYEDLLRDAGATVEGLCRRLGIEWVPGMIHYGQSAQPAWQMGASGVYRHNAPDPANLDKWRENLTDAQLWRVVSDYLDKLDSKSLETFSIDRAEARKGLDRLRPPALRLATTRSLTNILSRSSIPTTQPVDLPYRLRRSIQVRGAKGTLAGLWRKLAPKPGSRASPAAPPSAT